MSIILHQLDFDFFFDADFFFETDFFLGETDFFLVLGETDLNFLFEHLTITSSGCSHPFVLP